MARPPYPYKSWAAYQQARGGDLRLGRRLQPPTGDWDVYRLGIWSPRRNGVWLWVDRPDEVPAPADPPKLLDLAERGASPVEHVIEGPFPYDTVSQSVAAYQALLEWDASTVLGHIPLNLLVQRNLWDVLVENGYPQSVNSLTDVAGLALWEAWMRWDLAQLRHDAPGAVFWARLVVRVPDWADELWDRTPAGADGIPVSQAWAVLERNGYPKRKSGNWFEPQPPPGGWGPAWRRRR